MKIAFLAAFVIVIVIAFSVWFAIGRLTDPDDPFWLIKRILTGKF